jgi:hypothetical protein
MVGLELGYSLLLVNLSGKLIQNGIIEPFFSTMTGSRLLNPANLAC